jgi:hypothetical protein
VWRAGAPRVRDLVWHARALGRGWVTCCCGASLLPAVSVICHTVRVGHDGYGRCCASLPTAVAAIEGSLAGVCFNRMSDAWWWPRRTCRGFRRSRIRAYSSAVADVALCVCRRDAPPPARDGQRDFILINIEFPSSRDHAAKCGTGPAKSGSNLDDNAVSKRNS